MKIIALIIIASSFAFAQPEVPSFDIFWIGRENIDSSFYLELDWNVSATIDTNRVEMVEYDTTGKMLRAFDYWVLSDTVNRVKMRISDLSHRNYYFLRYRASNADGESEWSSIKGFSSGLIPMPVWLAAPKKGNEL